MSKEFKELKDVNFSVRPVNFATLDDIVRRNLAIAGGTVAATNVPQAQVTPKDGSATVPVVDSDLLTEKRRLVAERNRIRSELRAGRMLSLDPAENSKKIADLGRIENEINSIDNRRRFLRIQNTAGARGLVAAQMGEIQAQINKLVALGVDPAKLTNIESINRELRIRNMPEIRNMRNVAGAIGTAVAKPVAPVPAATGNAFDRVVRRIGGVAKRHPVLAGITGLAAIGGAVRIAKAREDGRIDPDSYYIMDNNSMSMVPRAFPSRESAMYIRDERYPGAAINKGTTLLQKA